MATHKIPALKFRKPQAIESDGVQAAEGSHETNPLTEDDLVSDQIKSDQATNARVVGARDQECSAPAVSESHQKGP